MQPSPIRVALRHLDALTVEAPLNGLPRRKAVGIVNAAISRPQTGGIFRDAYWQGVKSVWKALEQAGIDFNLTKSDYEHEGGKPVRKVWAFEVAFINDKGRPDTVYGRVVAAGAGSVEEPLAAYDVTAYAS